MQPEKLPDPIVRAIFTIMTVPLGAEGEGAYLEMKEIVLSALDTLVEAGGFQEQRKEAFKIVEQGISEFMAAMEKKPS